MKDLLTKYDAWLHDGGPAALVIREHLMPVEGRDGVVFPATFAAEQGNDPDRFRGGYNLDDFGNAENCCLVDSAGSQANRVEPEFAKPKYRDLVPQITIKAGDKVVSLFDAGHRAGDAIVRCTSLQQTLQLAFKAEKQGDVQALAKIAPTSLVFGYWDSRDTQSKRARIVSSTIRAWNVRRLTRHAQHVPAVGYVEEGLLPEAEPTGADYASRGYKHQPIGRQPDPKKPDPTHGGVIATGGVRREATLNLAALRLLKAGTDQVATLVLRRYILGLSLVAFTHPSAFVGYLRQGCTLVLDPDAKPTPREFTLVHPDGKRDPKNIEHKDALDYAQAAAKEFQVGENRDVTFDKDAAMRDVTGTQQDTKGKRGKKGTAPANNNTN